MTPEQEALAKLQSLSLKKIELTDVVKYTANTIQHGYRFCIKLPNFRETTLCLYEQNLDKAVEISRLALDKMRPTYPFGLDFDLPSNEVLTPTQDCATL